MSILEKLKKNSTISQTSVLSESNLFDKDKVSTPVPMMNVALGGSLEGGLSAGHTMLAGPSKHFKTSFALLIASAYLKKYDDAVALFYDSEFGSPQDYFESFGIDPARVMHTPITNIEQLKFDLMRQMDMLERGDRVIIIIDSIGNVASKKEVEDALNEKSVADMTRAKAMKSLFRMVTPHLTIKNIPLLTINHVYSEQGLFPKTIVSGGCLSQGTKIQVEDGLKNIEDISVGDFVRTMDGYQPVTHVWNPETLEEGMPECYEIEFEDGSKVICSDKHQFIVNDEWVEAKDLTVGSEVRKV